MSVWDNLNIDDEKKKKKSSVWDAINVQSSEGTPSQQARAENQFSFRDNPKASSFDTKNPMDFFKEPTFLEGKQTTPATTQKTQAPAEEMVRQFDGKMVPKSQARNSYGGLIYGQTIGGEKSMTEAEYAIQKLKNDPSLSNLGDAYSAMGKNALEKIQSIPEKVSNFGENLYNSKPFMTLDDIVKESYKPKRVEEKSITDNVKNMWEDAKGLGSLAINTTKYAFDKLPDGFSVENPLHYEANVNFADKERMQSRETKIQEGNATRKEMSQGELDFIKNNPGLGEMYKTGKQFVLRTAPEGGLNAVSAVTQPLDIDFLQNISKWAGDTADDFTKSKVQNYQENASKDILSFTDGGYKDPRYYGKAFGQIVPQFLMSIGIAVATKKPQAGLAFGYSQETGQAYTDLLDRGIAPSDAKNGAIMYGAISTALEGVNFTKYTNKLLGSSVAQEVKQTWKQSIIDTLKEGGVDIFKEGVTEGAQQFAQNVMTRFYDKNQDLFEGVMDSSVMGALGGVGYSSMGLGKAVSENSGEITDSMKKTYSQMKENISTARDIVSGKMQAENESQSIIARQVLSSFQNKAKETALTIYDPQSQTPFTPNQENRVDPIIKVETVQYDDGKYSASVTANINNATTTLPFGESFKLKNDAIKNAIEEAKTHIGENIPVLDIPTEDLMKQYQNEMDFSNHETYADHIPTSTIQEWKDNGGDIAYTDFVKNKISTSAMNDPKHTIENLVYRNEDFSNTDPLYNDVMKAYSAIMGVEKRIIKRDTHDKYSQIELNANKNKLFRKFVDVGNEYIASMSGDGELTMSIQELFDSLDATKPTESYKKGSNEKLIDKAIDKILEADIMDLPKELETEVKNILEKIDPNLSTLYDNNSIQQFRNEQGTAHAKSKGHQKNGGEPDSRGNQQTPSGSISEEYTSQDETKIEHQGKTEVGKRTPTDKGDGKNGNGSDEGKGQSEVSIGTSKSSIVNALKKVDESTVSEKPIFSEIDHKIAMEASRGTSFDPEKRGASRIREFNTEMQEMYADLLKYAKTNEQKEFLNNEVSMLSGRLAVKQNEINRANSQVVSSMIAGPARFPVARMQKRNDAIRKKEEEYTDFKNRAINGIIKKLKGQEVEDAGGPIEVLKKEIETMKKNQELSKKINETIRKFKTDEAIRPELEKLGISEKTISDLLTPYLGKKGIQSFSLTNLNNKIKDREAKLAKMEKAESLKGTEEATKILYEFLGGKVVDNRVESRVQILFDEKPNKSTVDDLKKSGWRWSPTNLAWQRFRNSGSVQNARSLFPEIQNESKNIPDAVAEIEEDRKGSFASFVESPGVSGFEKRDGGNTEQFKLSERIKEIIQNLDTHYTRYVSPDSKGTFYTKTGNIAIRSLNDIDTVHHELSHLIDIQQGITDKYKNNQEMIDALTNIYQTYYPGAKSTDGLDVRLKEGYAVLQQKYLSNPTVVMRDFPELVTEFIDNGDMLQKKLNGDMQKLVSDYQGLSDKDKIGAVMSDNLHNIGSESFLKGIDKIEATTVDAILPFVKLESDASTKTGVDSLLYASKSINGRVAKNISEKKMGFWHFKNGEMTKMYDYNWASLIHEIGKKNQLDNFSIWLIARDQVGQYERLDRMNAKLRNMEEGEEREALTKRRDEVYNYLQSNSQILDKKTMESVNREYESAFAPYAEKFDAMLKADINFLHDTGILSDDHYEAIMKTEGYAPIRRLLDDGIIGGAQTDTNIGGIKIGKATQIKSREGGTMDILNPVLGALQNHMEAVQKGYKQMTVNKVYDLVEQFPNLGQAFEPTVTVIGGKETYTTPDGKPLSMDADIIMKMENGKPKPMGLHKELVETLQGVFSPKKRGGIEKIFTGATQLFTKGTTGIYIPFFLTNMIRDQFTAISHSKNGYIPVVDQLRELLPAVLNRSGEEMQYIREYISLGGHQNRLKWNESTGQEILSDIQEGQQGWRKWIGYVNSGIDILAIPANLSETGTRVIEYIKSRKSGKNMWESLEDAGQLTAPFHHQGRIMADTGGRMYMRSMPFFNATIQGLSQYLRTARTAKGRKNIGKVLIGTTALILGGIAAIFGMGDDEDKQAIMDMDPQMFAKFLFLPARDASGELYKIPLPQELGFIGAIFGMVLTDSYGGMGYSPKEYVGTATSFLPDQVNFTDPEKMALSLIPQLIKPAIEIALNKKTFPKVGNIESQTMLRMPSEFRYTKATSDFAKWAGSTSIAKEMGISPIQVDHFLTGQFGRSIGYATGKDTAINPMSSLTQGRYFTSGRMVEKYYEEKATIDEKLTAESKGLITLKDSEVIELKARKKELADIGELIADYSALDIKSEDTAVINSKRKEAWDAINSYFDNGVVVTEVDKMKYEKSQEQDAWKTKKEDMMTRYSEEYANATGITKGTLIERKIKEEMGGAKMDQTDKRRYTDFVKDFRVMRDYKDDSDVQEIYKASTNDEKLILFKVLKEKLGNDEYMKKRAELRKNQIISDSLWKELRKQDK